MLQASRVARGAFPAPEAAVAEWPTSRLSTLVLDMDGPRGASFLRRMLARARSTRRFGGVSFWRRFANQEGALILSKLQQKRLRVMPAHPGELSDW